MNTSRNFAARPPTATSAVPRQLTAFLALALCLAGLSLPTPALAQGGVILMGIDAEDHGSPGVYANVIGFFNRQCQRNAGSGILVLGGGKNPTDDVTSFWNQVGNTLLVPVKQINGAQIAVEDFTPYAMLAVSSDGAGTPGGLTQAEHDMLVARQADIAKFINAGGTLLGFNSSFPAPYDYISTVGSITADTNNGYSDITATAAGLAVGITDNNLDLKYWHDYFKSFPPFLEVLATDANNGEIAAIGGCEVEVPSPCGAITEGPSSILCPTDGSGDFTYTFDFTNNTADEIHHLFLVEPEPVGVVFEPSYIDFTASPICSQETPGCSQADATRSISVKIRNAQPGQTVGFKVTIHDRDVQECCAVEHEIELPACDCAQLSKGAASCVYQFFPFKKQHRINFTLDNLLGMPVEHVLITPSSGSDVTVSPNIFSGQLAGVPYSGSQGQLTGSVGLSGPDAVTGRNVCLRFSSHDEDFEDCCSIERCFDLASCRFDVIDVWPLGHALLAPFETALRLFDLGNSGEDGVELELEPADRFELGAELTGTGGEVPPGAALRVAALGSDAAKQETALASLEVRGTEAGSSLLAASPFSTGGTLRVFRQGREVATTDLGAGEAVTASRVEGPIIVVVIRDGDDIIIIVLVPRGVSLPALAGDGGSLFADELRFVLSAREAPASLSTARLTTVGIPELLLTDARSERTDCNANGIPDGADIRSGSSADADGDGVPDECQARAENLSLDLATGFDDQAGALVAPGAKDDDWQIVGGGAPQPARRVASPNRGWAPALPGSAWISLEGQRGASQPGLDTLRFERCFCLSPEAAHAHLDLALRADDSATVFLNGGQIGGPGGKFNSSTPLEIDYSGELGPSLFRAGENCLAVEVEDSGRVVTGLNLSGTVEAENGRCDAQP